MGLFTTIRTYLQLGRVFSAMLTAGAAILGALLSGIQPTGIQFLALGAIGFFSHAFGCSLNEICDLNLDRTVPEITNKPLVSGEITLVQAYTFSLGSLFASLLLVVLVFPYRLALAFFILANVMVAIYDIKGKYTIGLYDTSLASGFLFYTLFGAAAVGAYYNLGEFLAHPLILFAAGAIFLFEVLFQWVNAMKDVDTDRKFNVPTSAVRWGYHLGKELTIRDPNIVYGFSIRLGIIALLLIGNIFYAPRAFAGLTWFLIVFLVVGVPFQLLTFYRLLGRKKRDEYIRIVVGDVLVTWFLISFFVADVAGLVVALALFLLPIVWFGAIVYMIYGTVMAPQL